MSPNKMTAGRRPTSCPSVLAASCLLLALACLTTSATAETDTTGTKCYKNKDLGEYDANIYYCTDENKPECCEEDQQFTCCEKKTDRTIKNQLILWGAVFGVVGAVAFAWICYRKDTYMCEGETLSQRLNRCCGCEKKVRPDEEITLSDLNAADEKSLPDPDTAPSSGKAYYDDGDPLPVTARQVTPVVRQKARGGDVTGGNDSDSGRGSTGSIDVIESGSVTNVGGRPTPTEAGRDGTPPTSQHGPEVTSSSDDTTSTGKKKKRRKQRGKKNKIPAEIKEEEEFT